MTDVDVSKIKVGDVVGVRVVRTSADLNYVTVAASQGGGVKRHQPIRHRLPHPCS